MSYSFLDAYSSVQSADSSVISGGVQRPIVNIGSILSAVPTTFSGSPSISGAVTIVGNPSISGTVNIGTLPSVYGNISGSVVSFQGTTPWTVSSVYGNISGSVVAFQGTSPWIVNSQNSSILAVPVGSVIAVLQNPSIAGTYAEDAAHTTGDRGIFALNLRNDTLSSVTGTDGDYSPLATGPSGESIAVDAPFTKWVSGVADLRVVLGASVVAIAAPGASIFTYVREVQVANFGPSSVLVKIGGGLGSTLGWTIAPAGGGSNFTTRYKTGENSAITASINGTASVLVTISGFTAKT